MGYGFKRYDLFGQVLGKAKRRAVELDWKLIGKRFGAGLAVTAGVARANPDLLTTPAGRWGLAATFAGTMVPFGGGGSAGILTPAAPGLASLAGAALAAVTVPIAQRRQATQALKAQAVQDLLAAASQAGAAAAQELLNKTNMDGIPADQLAQKDPLAQPPIAPGAAPDAVAITGGNQ